MNMRDGLAGGNAIIDTDVVSVGMKLRI